MGRFFLDLPTIMTSVIALVGGYIIIIIIIILLFYSFLSFLFTYDYLILCIMPWLLHIIRKQQGHGLLYTYMRAGAVNIFSVLLWGRIFGGVFFLGGGRCFEPRGVLERFIYWFR